MDRVNMQRNIRKLRIEQADNMVKYGWIAHAVPANYHTHGVEESFNHPDLQVTLPIDPSIIHGLVNDMINNIKEGKKYEDGNKYSEVIDDFDVLIKQFKDGKRIVHRIIFPDPNGLFPDEEGCQDVYNAQFDLISD